MKTYKKTEHFDPIAMKCTQGQFNELKPIFEDLKILEKTYNFEDFPYLVNNSNGVKLDISNYDSFEINNFNRSVHETFNSETFLKACGIVEVEKTYTISETFVKELIKEPNIKEAFIREGIIENDKIKQTAVEWLCEKYHLNKDAEIIKQAKEMEKQQIIDALHYFGIERAEQYYNEKFKK